MQKYNNVTSADDFMQERGIDMYQELTTIRVGDLGDPELEVECFIHQVEDYLENYYSVYYGFNGDVHNLKFQNQINCFKKATISQALYYLAHPDIRKAIENSITLPKDALRDLGVDVDAEMYMRRGGFANV